MTLEELRRAAIAGQPGARDELARRLRAMFWGGLSKRFPSDVADDLTQQALLKIFAKLDDFTPWHDDDAFERWVKVICSREALNHSSKQHKALTRGLYDVDALAQVADADNGPSTRVRNQDLLKAIAGVIGKLTTPLRETAKALIAGERATDSAKRQGVPQGTVSWRRVKVRRLIAQALATPPAS